MVSEGRGRLFRRKDGKYLIYVPKDLAKEACSRSKAQTPYTSKRVPNPAEPKNYS